MRMSTIKSGNHDRLTGRRMAIGLLMSIFVMAVPFWSLAASFPVETADIVQDEASILDENELQELLKQVSHYDEEYKVVTVPTTSPADEQEYVEQLFEQYEMNRTSILLVLVADNEKLAVKTGEQIADIGVRQKNIDDKIVYYYQPYVLEKNYTTGILSVIKEIHALIEEAGGIESFSGASSEQAAEQEETKGASVPWWLMILFLFLAFLIVYAVFSMVKRRLLIKRIDETDEWREEVNQRLIDFQSDPENKILFQSVGDNHFAFQKELEQISADELPQIDVLLAEAEEYCDRLRFGKGKRLVEQACEQLEAIESTLNELENQVSHFQGLMEENQELWTTVRKLAATSERKLDEHRFAFGFSFPQLKEELGNYLERVKETGENYVSDDDSPVLNQVLKDLHESGTRILSIVEALPLVRKELEELIPKDLRQLDDDIIAFYEEGFHHLSQFSEFPERLRRSLEATSSLFADGDIHRIQQEIQSLRSEIEDIYRLMEEAYNRERKLEDYLNGIPLMLKELHEKQVRLKQELIMLSERYQLEGEDVQEFYAKAEVAYQRLEAQYQEAENMMEDKKTGHEQALATFSEVERDLRSWIELSGQMLEELKGMTRDEEFARNEWRQLKIDLVNVEQLLKRHILPDVPEHLRNGIIIARSAMEEAEQQFARSPIDMHRIHHYMEDARERVKSAVSVVEQAIFHCTEAEKMIQMTNRFRRNNPEVEHLLSSAENAFHNLEFDEAYQLAQNASHLATGQGSMEKLKKWVKWGDE